MKFLLIVTAVVEVLAGLALLLQEQERRKSRESLQQKPS